MKKTKILRLLALAGLFLLAGVIHWNGAFSLINNGLASLRMGMVSEPASKSIVLLEIDNKSLSAIGTWPWKRSIYADIVKKSFEHGAEELAFDIDFSARSSEEEDHIFAQALADAEGPVTLAIFRQHLDAELEKTNIQTNRPIDELGNNAWASTVNVLADGDGIVRRFPYAQYVDEELVPSLASTLGAQHNLSAQNFYVDFGIDAESIPVYSIIDLLHNKLDLTVFQGKKVIVGAGAAELRDTLAVPVYGMLTGPKLQVLAAETLLQHRDMALASETSLLALSLLTFLLASTLALSLKLRVYSKLGLLALCAGFTELLAFGIYLKGPALLDTALIHGQLAGAGIAIILMDVQFKTLLLSLSQKHSQSLSHLLETIVEDSFSGIIICNQSGEILEVSEKAKTMLKPLGWSPQKGIRNEHALPSKMLQVFEDCFSKPELFDEAHQLNELTIWAGDDGMREVILQYSITPSLVTGSSANHDEDQGHEEWVATLMFHDVTKSRQEQRRLAYLADHDPVTDLLNEQGFCFRVDQHMLDNEEPQALIMACGVRRLSKIRQSLGMEHGDLLMQQVASQLKALDCFDIIGCSAQNEFLLCRMGVSATDAPSEIERLSQILVDMLETPFSLRGHNVIAGSHIGIADFETGGELAEEVTKAALVAMHRSKEQDSAYLLYSSDLAADVMHRRVLEREIIDAMERKEFEMHYQPQTSLKTGEIIGCEALIRWNHRDLGFIRPDLFIPIMEETGMIVELGRWILNQVCQDAMLWPKPVSVAANISAIQFTRSNILEDIDQALTLSGLPAKRLHAEITESLFISDPNAIIDILKAMQERNITIALDDFGTGYSSLSYIHQFPLDKIKIDQAFVKNLPHSMDSMAVINAIVALARNFDMEIVAEGVETKDQWDVLRLAGCHIGQGWHFGKSMPNSEFMALLEQEEASELTGTIVQQLAG
ncbi:MAG: EAL domain-containing protein [Cohaesibacter sp.]|jgi:EAL domain-containing protein (putative c-di-GMP-specific phosphodiesterase class I)/CHASE2 domain-containing sensor protein|nr:EAL domain-containing protein [Cohaesibacter sp.]